MSAIAVIPLISALLLIISAKYSLKYFLVSLIALLIYSSLFYYNLWRFEHSEWADNILILGCTVLICGLHIIVTLIYLIISVVAKNKKI
jgi:hypothetical protein